MFVGPRHSIGECKPESVPNIEATKKKVGSSLCVFTILFPLQTIFAYIFNGPNAESYNMPSYSIVVFVDIHDVPYPTYTPCKPGISSPNSYSQVLARLSLLDTPLTSWLLAAGTRRRDTQPYIFDGILRIFKYFIFATCERKCV